MENIRQRNRLMLVTHPCVDLAALSGAASTGLQIIGPSLLTVCDFIKPLVVTCSFKVAVAKGFSASAYIE